MKFAKLLTAAAVATTMTGAANAAVLYEFTSFSTFQFGTTEATYSVTTADFITSNVTLPAPDCVITTPTGLTCEATQRLFADENVINNSGDNYDVVGLSIDGGALYYFYFANGVFGSYGTYDTVLFGSNQAGRLVISEAVGSVVPEPASWAMMIGGFGLVGGAMRRHRVAQTKVSFA